MSWTRGFHRLFVVLGVAWAVASLCLLVATDAGVKRSIAADLRSEIAKYDRGSHARTSANRGTVSPGLLDSVFGPASSPDYEAMEVAAPAETATVSTSTYLDESGHPIRQPSDNHTLVEVVGFGLVAFPESMTTIEVEQFLNRERSTVGSLSAAPKDRLDKALTADPLAFLASEDEIAVKKLEDEAEQWFITNRKSQLVEVEREASFLRQLALSISFENLPRTASVLFLPPLLLYIAGCGAMLIGRWIVVGFRSPSK